MTQIPWSAEGERRLRKRITMLRSIFFLSCILGVFSLFAGFMFSPYGFAIAVLLFVCAVVSFIFVIPLIDELGWEPSAPLNPGAPIIPGSGMLANKPLDTSRLTRWVRHTRDEAPLGFTCWNCKRPYDWKQMKWTANLVNCEEEMGDVPAVAVDPDGGRWVLVCECGVGHYMLQKND